MLPSLIISTLLSGTAFYTFYKWAVSKGYLAKQNLKQFVPKFLTENSTGLGLIQFQLNRFTPTNVNNRISKEKYILLKVKSIH